MSDLAIPGSAAPNNLHFAGDVRAVMVEHDLYDICTRLQEIDSSLFIVLLHDDAKYKYTIMEHCADGWDRTVWSVKELDARVLDKAARLKAIPFEKRFEEAEKMEAKMEAEVKEEEFEKLYETLGAPMLRQLRHDGFTDGNFTNYRKIGKGS